MSSLVEKAPIVPLLDDAEPFQCYICLDLLFKPVVHSCGHVFCFWCAHRAMDSFKQSHCPLCRKPFIHFPRVCELFHFLLMKVMPEDYNRRAQETQKMEVEEGVFSPRILQSWRTPCKDEAIQGMEVGRPVENSGNSVNAKLLDTDGSSSPLFLNETCQEVNAQKRSDCEEQVCNEIRAEDLSCTSCRKFLYRPVVLHCGEVFCEPCVQKTDSLFNCPSCQYTHPEGCVCVCLNLHHYLERSFPDFVLKRKTEADNTAQVMVKEMSKQTAQVIGKEMSHCKAMAEYGVIHDCVGCDGCGMCPIVGERYKCSDCPEPICYDLCGCCYAKGIHCIGRFNQQHTADHRMQRMPGDLVRCSGPLKLYLLNGLVIQRRHHSSQQFADADDYHHINSYL